MKVTSGKIPSAQKVVLYGVEGIGKSTFASHFPGALFIDTEGSTKHLDVHRLPTPESWTMLMQEVDHVRRNPDLCTTLVIDTADWAEQLCLQHVCATIPIDKNGGTAKGIEDYGYGKGYTYLEEEFGRLLNLLNLVVERAGVNVLLTTHAIIRKFEPPEEAGAYDRWEMNLEKKVAPLVKAWADMLLFANYKTYVVNVDGKGVTKGKNKAQGGSRVMFTNHTTAWDAKNRAGLDDELPFDFAHIAQHIPGKGQGPYAYADSPETPQAVPEPVQAPPAPVAQPEAQVPAPAPKAASARPEGIPDALWQLMQQDDVNEEHLRYAVFKRGYYPYETPITKYDPAFINGVLIGAWPQVHQLVLENKNEMPF